MSQHKKQTHEPTPEPAKPQAEVLPPSTAVVPHAANSIKIGDEVTIGGRTYKTVRRVNRALLKHEDGQVRSVQFESPFYTGKELKGKKDGVAMAPARMAVVINLDTGEEMDYIVGSVLEGVLNDMYPNNAYVKKSFMIRKTATENKRYKQYEAIEIA